MTSTAYVSRAGALTIHSAGWLELPSGVRITRMPVVDGDTKLFARLGPTPAAAWAATKGYRLPTCAELDELHRASLYIAPYTMPTADMLREAGVALNDGEAVQRHRVANMRSLAWCEQHDAEVYDRLEEAGWVSQPVSNAGKHWADGGLIYGWWLETGKPIQSPSGAHRGGGGTHTDYGTTFHVVEARNAKLPRATKPGEKGADVEAWQRYLRAAGFDPGVIDGQHGPKTEAATQALMAARAAALPSAQVEMIEARNYTRVIRTSVDLVILHSTENPVRSGTARNVARWFAGPSAPQASAHYVVGPDEVLRCVREEAVAWAAPGANHHGIQIEMVGQAAKTDWSRDGRDDTAGLAVMRRTAELVRGVCERWNIPRERVDAAGLKAGKRGITTHAAVTEAFKKSTHIDPGCQGDARWPWELFLSLVCR